MQAPNSRALLGAFVIFSMTLFIAGLLQAGSLREWLNPSKKLNLILPDEGLYGLSEGAKVEILGTPAGRIVKIVIDPDQKIHAEARIDSSMADFIRRDSQAIIGKTFGVAGEGFLQISRGYKQPMDWDYAVLTAQADRAPTDSIGEIMEDVRSRVMPILEQTERTITPLADLAEDLADPDGSLQGMLADIRSLTKRIDSGEGSVGQLLTENTTSQQVQALLDNTNASIAAMAPILAQMETTMGEVNQSATQVPVLLGATQQTVAELEGLLRQLRGNWLLGGSGSDDTENGSRLSLTEVKP